jgi:putative hydrolase of the HAD superfamily
MGRDYRALLFDLGDVVTASQWEMLDRLEADTGRRLVGRGPLDPDGDALWQQYLRGELTYHSYWKAYAEAAGYSSWRALYRDFMAYMTGDDFAHPAAAALIVDARAAGLMLGALTNDGVEINGRAFFDNVPLIADFDTFTDAREYGGGKPAPEAYLGAASELGLEPDQIVFIDDLIENVEGARAVGMAAVLVDPVEREPGFDEVREMVGLPARR